MSKYEQQTNNQLDFKNSASSETVKEIKADGSFNRPKNRFTTPFGNKDGNLPIEAGRYRLFIVSIDQKGQNILPKGPDLSGLQSQHNRKVLSNKDEKFLIH